jgi:hypothetical protein
LISIFESSINSEFQKQFIYNVLPLIQDDAIKESKNQINAKFDNLSIVSIKDEIDNEKENLDKNFNSNIFKIFQHFSHIQCFPKSLQIGQITNLSNDCLHEAQNQITSFIEKKEEEKLKFFIDKFYKEIKSTTINSIKRSFQRPIKMNFIYDITDKEKEYIRKAHNDLNSKINKFDKNLMNVNSSKQMIQEQLNKIENEVKNEFKNLFFINQLLPIIKNNAEDNFPKILEDSFNKVKFQEDLNVDLFMKINISTLNQQFDNYFPKSFQKYHVDQRSQVVFNELCEKLKKFYEEKFCELRKKIIKIQQQAQLIFKEISTIIRDDF